MSSILCLVREALYCTRTSAIQFFLKCHHCFVQWQQGKPALAAAVALSSYGDLNFSGSSNTDRCKMFAVWEDNSSPHPHTSLCSQSATSQTPFLRHTVQYVWLDLILICPALSDPHVRLAWTYLERPLSVTDSHSLLLTPAN